jgi:hypothetical protein
MKKQIAYIALLAVIISSCTVNQVDKQIDQKGKEVLRNDTISLLLDQKHSSWLDIISLSRENSMLLQTRRDNHIISIAGYGNTEMVVNENSNTLDVDTVDFENDGFNEYVFFSFVKGSTYGAVSNYIVYYQDEWEIYRVPFDRTDIEKDEESNEVRIVSYNQSGTRSSFRFKKGILEQL